MGTRFYLFPSGSLAMCRSSYSAALERQWGCQAAQCRGVLGRMRQVTSDRDGAGGAGQTGRPNGPFCVP